MRAMLIAQAATLTPDFAAKPIAPPTLPAPATPRGNMTNSGAGACLMAHGARASDLRVVGQAMYDDMVDRPAPAARARSRRR